MKRNMKKLLCLLLALAVAAGALTACTGPNLESQPATTLPTTAPTQPKTQPTTVPTQPSTVPTQPYTEPPYIELEVLDPYGGAYIGLSGSSGVSRWPIVIKSVQDIQYLVDGDFAQPFRDYAAELLNRYDDAFFEEYTVIITCYDPCIRHTGLRGARCLKTQEGYYELMIDLLGATIGDFWVYNRIVHAVAVKADIPKNAIIYVTIPEEYGKLNFK